MSGDFASAKNVIAEEYRRICDLLAIAEVELDVYPAEDDSSAVVGTSTAGIDLRHTDPCYSGHRRVLVMPLLTGDFDFVNPMTFPPSVWEKTSPDWPPWRIELWHEVIHQYSDVALAAWNDKEPGRRRDDGSMSTTGHGVGWQAAIEKVASQLGTTPEVLDSLLDR